MRFQTFLLVHLMDVRLRLAAFLQESARRQLVAERDAKVWHLYHEVEEAVTMTWPKLR